MAKSGDIQKAFNKEFKEISLDVRYSDEEKSQKLLELTLKYVGTEVENFLEFVGPAMDDPRAEKKILDLIREKQELVKDLK